MIQISENIVKIIEKAGLKVRFIGSDSDPAYNEKKEEFFSEILDKIFPINDFSELEFKQNSINFYVHQFSFDKVYWCDDGSHILKRMRTRLVNYKVLYLIPGASSYVDINFFLQYCSDVMSKKALDTRSICSMDDWYPAQIYSSEIFFRSNRKQKLVSRTLSLASCCIKSYFKSKKFDKRRSFIHLLFWAFLNAKHIFTNQNN